MTDNVVMFHGETKLDLPPERILEAAKSAGLQSCIILGWLENEKLYVAFSTASPAENNMMLDLAKRMIADEFFE